MDTFATLALTPAVYAVVGALVTWLPPRSVLVGGAVLNLLLVGWVMWRTARPLHTGVLAPEGE
ncbi:hypothetical protein ACWCXX_33830 [Streptomyces sp. NPDC001732]